MAEAGEEEDAAAAPPERDTSTRAQQTVEHREIGRKPSARRGQHALQEQAIQAVPRSGLNTTLFMISA